jgi:hypothetical protein
MAKMGLFTSRRAKIQSHTATTLAQARQGFEDAVWDSDVLSAMRSGLPYLKTTQQAHPNTL